MSECQGYREPNRQCVVPLDEPCECSGLYEEVKCTLQAREIILERNNTTLLFHIYLFLQTPDVELSLTSYTALAMH